jgi:hypothetical protein
MFRQMFWMSNINNGVLQALRAMPQKDSTSDGTSNFEMSRLNYGALSTTRPNIHKKWMGNRDASQVTTNRRVSEVGVGSLNANRVPISYTTFKDINTTADALTRVRAGGAVAPAKKGANRKNAPTPSFRPALPVNDIVGIKYPVSYH